MDNKRMIERTQHEQAELEQRLRLALKRRAAPPELKQRVMAAAQSQRVKRSPSSRLFLTRSRGAERGAAGYDWMIQRIAASVLLAALIGGLILHYQAVHYQAAHFQSEQRREGEAAREQVIVALRITNKTLNRVNEHLSEQAQ